MTTERKNNRKKERTNGNRQTKHNKGKTARKKEQIQNERQKERKAERKTGRRT